jgi:two-component system phosphate regulon sensor histidine kinase PhoR
MSSGKRPANNVPDESAALAHKSSASGDDGGKMERQSPTAGSSGRFLLLPVAVFSIVCTFLFGAIGAFLARSERLTPELIGATAFAAIVTLTGWQLLAWRALRRAQVPLTVVKSRLAKILEAPELRPLHIGDGRSTAELVGLINKLIDATRTSQQSDSELEFANKVLIRERDRVRNTLDSVGTGVLAVGSDQRLIFANRAAEPFLIVTAKEVVGKWLQESVGDQQLLSFLTGPAGNTAGTADRMEISLDEAPSTPVFSVTASTITDDKERVLGKCVVFQDVTNVKRAESAREEFLNSVAHELRTPLTSIKAYVEMLIDGEAQDGDTKREFYNIIYEETDRLNRLIDNLLNISRVELGTVVVSRTPTRLKKLIEDSASVVESQVAKKELQLEIDLPDRLPAVEVDKDMMNVVLVNLLGNAVKYTPNAGHVAISSTSTAEEIIVHITDTGIGIADEDAQRVFDKFYRCTGKGNDEVPGSGLGLYITRQIMRLHGGDVTLSSRLGEGTQFSITIPRSAVVTSLGDYEHDQTDNSGR